MKNYSLADESLGYQTSSDPSNSDKRLLIAGSKNVVIDYQKKVSKRSGYTRLGTSNTNITEVRNAFTWDTSTGTHLPQRFYDDELEVYLNTIEGTVINAWTRIKDGWSTTEKLRSITYNGGAAWFDNTEKIDLQLMVQGDANIYEWNGAIAIVSSVTATTITKTGSLTFGQARFYSTRNKVVVCVRTRTEYTYTGGESTTTLTGISDTTGLVAGDILMQKVVTNSNKPISNHTNHFVYCNGSENQIAIGSEDDNLVYVSKNTDFTTFTPSTPRVAGEGFVLTLDAPCRAINSLGKSLIIFCGNHFIHRVVYEQITVGSTLAETVKSPRVDSGIDQGALNHESVISIGDSLAYLSNEVALRIISNPDDLTGIDPKTFSNPIKPDFDSEDFTGAFMTWYKNIILITSIVSSKMYMLNFLEDADGKLIRFWNPPQTLPIGPMSIINSGNGRLLHGHSNTVPETYLLFDGLNDGQYLNMDVNDKIAINAKAIYAYNSYGKKANLKNFDEYYSQGEITVNTENLNISINYDFKGTTQVIERNIDGSDEDILEGFVINNSLAQSPLAQNPMGGLLNPPEDARRFRVIHEIAKEDFFEISVTYSDNAIDTFWSILAHGCNAAISRRRATNKFK